VFEWSPVIAWEIPDEVKGDDKFRWTTPRPIPATSSSVLTAVEYSWWVYRTPEGKFCNDRFVVDTEEEALARCREDHEDWQVLHAIGERETGDSAL
jgi:hypothetical protein